MASCRPRVHCSRAQNYKSYWYSVNAAVIDGKVETLKFLFAKIPVTITNIYRQLEYAITVWVNVSQPDACELLCGLYQNSLSA